MRDRISVAVGEYAMNWNPIMARSNMGRTQMPLLSIEALALISYVSVINWQLYSYCWMGNEIIHLVCDADLPIRLLKMHFSQYTVHTVQQTVHAGVLLQFRCLRCLHGADFPRPTANAAATVGHVGHRLVRGAAVPADVYFGDEGGLLESDGVALDERG